MTSWLFAAAVMYVGGRISTSRRFCRVRYVARFVPLNSVVGWPLAGRVQSWRIASGTRLLMGESSP